MRSEQLPFAPSAVRAALTDREVVLLLAGQALLREAWERGCFDADEHADLLRRVSRWLVSYESR